ncbi:MAG: hypothetical protein SF097_14850 [Acidobacteriota bacterium]|nr:hypothetical protein [Acidobacteriota bacterium]
MKSIGKNGEKLKANAETPGKPVLSPRARRASNRAQAAPSPSENRAVNDVKARPTTIENSTSVPSQPRTITLVESQPTIRREIAEPHAIDVYALPNYETNRRTDSEVRVWCGQIAGGSNIGLEITARWGAGHYWLIERKASGQLGKQTLFFSPTLPQIESNEDDQTMLEDDNDIVEVDELPEDLVSDNIRLKIELARFKERDRIRAEMLPQQNAPAVPSLGEQINVLLKLDELRSKGRTEPPPTPQKNLIEQLRELKQVEALLLPKGETPLPQPIREEPIDPRVTVLQMLLDDPDSAKGMASKLRGLFSGETELPPEPQTTFWDFATAAMESLAPVLPALVHRFVGAPVGNALSGIADDSTNTLNTQPQSSLPTTPSQPRTMTAEQHFEKAGEVVIDGLMKNANQQQAADALKSVIDRNRLYAPTVIELVKLTPEQVIEQLKPMWAAIPVMAEKLEAPHVITWLSDVLNRVRNAAGIEPTRATDTEIESG